MKWTVIWIRAPLVKLAHIYLRADHLGYSANAVTQAMATIDAVLAKNPTGVGESREANQRILVVDPFVIVYEAPRRGADHRCRGASPG